MDRILILVDSARNRTLLSEYLQRDHEVLIGEGDRALDETFDLCVIDDRALHRFFDEAIERRRREEPQVLPFLLLTTRRRLDHAWGRLWQVVDDVIIAPVRKSEFRARVEVMLRNRRLSLDVARRAELAERAAAARDLLLAMVSHDLRNMLNSVLMSAHLLLDAPLDEAKRREQLEIIRRSSEAMNRLIQDLLDVASIEAGRLAVDRQLQPVAPVLREACEMVRARAEEKGLELECDLPGDLPELPIDRDRVIQAVVNLLDNALKFTPEGGRIVVRAERSGDGVVTRVSDTGAGIPLEVAPHVFDRFWRSRYRKERGAGLGLTIVKGIIEAHGGAVAVEPHAGPGTTIRFTLPG